MSSFIMMEINALFLYFVVWLTSLPFLNSFVCRSLIFISFFNLNRYIPKKIQLWKYEKDFKPDLLDTGGYSSLNVSEHLLSPHTFDWGSCCFSVLCCVLCTVICLVVFFFFLFNHGVFSLFLMHEF